ncbi:FUSC family protein [Dyella sp. M7H15-1]|uniref:FUSC family protein n=1 Tax=Dyella sp. M7H15-1 TaxID=2501295 RepID=UPI0013E8CDC7|nr:FUSC family protein [Dyella sp. M7H15-1]
MRIAIYKAYIEEAIKITFFCLSIVVLFKICGAPNNTLIIVFNMAVMSFAATFSSDKKRLSHSMLGSAVVVLSIITGGLAGYYFPRLTDLLTLLYACLAFFLPNTREKVVVYVTGAVMFLIFTSLPLDWQDGVKYGLDGLAIILIFTGFHWFFNRRASIDREYRSAQLVEDRYATTLLAFFSLSGAFVVVHILRSYTTLSHLYWTGLTVLLIIQGGGRDKIRTSLMRMGVNIVGALATVLLFGYVAPPIFIVNLIILVLFLFFIFALGFSYVGRTLFIEMFVLGFSHLIGNYANTLAGDRVILTLIGGAIVIGSIGMVYVIFWLFSRCS